MFNLKKIGTAVAVVALTSFGAAGANAALISPDDGIRHTLNLNVPHNALNIAPTLAGVGETVGANGGVDFVDQYLFHLPDASAPSGSQPVRYSFDVTFANAQESGVGVRNLTFSFFDQTNGVALRPDLIVTGNIGTALGDIENGAFNFTGIWPAPIDLLITATGETISDGSYSLTLRATTVPLPASVLMLVGALAGLGFVGRMKRSRFAAA